MTCHDSNFDVLDRYSSLGLYYNQCFIDPQRIAQVQSDSEDVCPLQKQTAWTGARTLCKSMPQKISEETSNVKNLTALTQLHVPPLTRPYFECTVSTPTDINSSISPSATTQIAPNDGLAPPPAISAAATSIVSNAGAFGNRAAASGPPVTRDSRGQLAYDTQQVDSRTAWLLQYNRARAVRSQQLLSERARGAEAALARSLAEKAALEAQLAEVLRFIEQLGYSAPSAAYPKRSSQ